jgi:translation initiation factor IF-2
MNIDPILIFVLAQVVGLMLVILPPRIRMARHARGLLAQYPGAEQTSVDLELQSKFAWDKRREMDARKAEMQLQGWTFLRASSVNFFRSMRSRGGALTLHFIRTKV